MAALANIVIADALGTPVNHTFVPAPQPNGVVEWQDQTAANNPLGVPVGFNRIIGSGRMSKDTNQGRGSFVLDLRYVMPVLETVSNSTQSGILPAATWAYDCTCFIKVVASSRSSLQNRLDLLKMAPLALANAQLTDWFKSYQAPF